VIDYMAAVTEFHRLYNLPVGDWANPAPLDAARTDLRLDLIEEECEEVVTAAVRYSYSGSECVPADDLPALAKELADLIYVTVGYAVELGIDINAVFQEVHFSNMSKLDDNGLPVLREDGKVEKGPNYYSPDIASIIEQQGRLPQVYGRWQ
jgi:predicted HAD superfamily Cof-like phosphohydrolase